jgi:hypothetical protein
MSLMVQQRTFPNAPAQARGHLKVPISAHPGSMPGRCTSSCASSQRWGRSSPSCNSFFGRFTATRRPWIDLKNIAAIFAAAGKKAHSVAATAESIQSVDFGSGVEPGSRRDRALRASRIETKIDRLTQKSGDPSKISLISCFFFSARHLFNG